MDIGYPHNWQFLPLWIGGFQAVVTLRSTYITAPSTISTCFAYLAVMDNFSVLQNTNYFNFGRSYKWTNEDWSKAMRLRCAGRKGYNIARAEHVPLPHLNSLSRKFRFIHVGYGIIQATVECFRTLVLGEALILIFCFFLTDTS